MIKRDPAARVDVIIPNFNGLEHLEECLDALMRQSFSGFSVTLVDNASRDDSVQWVRRHHPGVAVIEREDNRGFAAAVNAGIRCAAGEYVVLLNNDTVAEPQWLRELVAALDANPLYDFAASRMTLNGRPDRLNAAGDVYSVIRLAGVNRGFGRPAERYGREQRVLGACAGAAIYRRELFEHVGVFDESFFLMGEDTDFNLRCLIAGRRCLYVPSAVVRHKLRATIDLQPAHRMVRLAWRNEAMVAAKDLPLVVLLCPLLWVSRGVTQWIVAGLSDSPVAPAAPRHWRTRLDAELGGARLGWRKRREVWRLRRVSMLEILRWLVRGSGPV